MPTAGDWAKSALHKAGVDVTGERANALLEGADAVYRYDEWLWQQASGSYKFDGVRNAGDLIDSMQLFYLADPRMYFLTGDKRLRARIEASTKKAQVLMYDDLAAEL